MKSVVLALVSSMVFAALLAYSRRAEALPPQHWYKCRACLGDRCYRMEDGSIDCYVDKNGWCYQSSYRRFHETWRSKTSGSRFGSPGRVSLRSFTAISI